MDIRTILEKFEKTMLTESKKDAKKEEFYVEKDGDEYCVFDPKGKSKGSYTEKKEADKACKEMNKTLKENVEVTTEAPVEKDDSEAPKDNETKIKPAMGFERFLKLMFKEEDRKIGRIALRKILNNKEDMLTLRERTVMSYSAIRLIPILADDRVTFQRIERKLSE